MFTRDDGKREGREIWIRLLLLILLFLRWVDRYTPNLRSWVAVVGSGEGVGLLWRE